jgi:hypothetical protein
MFSRDYEASSIDSLAAALAVPILLCTGRKSVGTVLPPGP